MMNSDEFQTIAKSQATMSINQSNINATKMKNIEIPVPRDLKIQEKIYKEIYKCDLKIIEMQKLIKELVRKKDEVIKNNL